MSPRSKAQFEVIREASMKKIMEASLELFGTRGYDATSIDQIAKAAGVSKGLIYNYFDSKEALLKSLIAHLMEEGEHIMLHQTTEDPKVKLRSIFSMTFDWLRHNQQLNRMIFSLTMQVEKFDFVHDLAISKMREYLKILENLLRDIGIQNYKEEARFLSIVFDGIGVQLMVLKEDYPLNEIEQMLIKRYCT